jgi:signal transduction histidine kinase
MVDACGGTIDVTSDVGKGTTFTIRLPRSRRTAQATAVR